MEYSYRFRIYPNIAQASQIQRTFGCCRYVFNHYLSRRKEEWDNHKINFSYYKCSSDLTALKRDPNYSWLKEVDATALQSSLRDLENAFLNFFRALKSGYSVGYPNYKKKSSMHKCYKSKCIARNIEVVGSKLKLPKLGLVKCRISKEIQGRILSASISQNQAGQYYVSLCCAEVLFPELPATGNSCGIDLGVSELAVTSDGRVFPNSRYRIEFFHKFSSLERQLARKQKGSRRYIQLNKRIAKLREHIYNQRKDCIHKATTELIRNYDNIYMEDLDIRGMLKNHKLSMAVKDASFFEFRRQMEYKARYYGRNIFFIDQFYPSSQICSRCGNQSHFTKNLRVREWSCPFCGARLDRDLNAAINILKKGASDSA